MRRDLGSLFFLIIALLHVEIFASTYEWSVTANKTKVYTGEAIHLKYTCEFSDRAELYSIEFNPVGDYKDYTIELLSESRKVVDKKKINSYEFIVFIKRAGSYDFDFEALMKKTNDDSIKNTVLGRDNAFYEESTNKVVRLKRLHIDALEASSNIVGEYKLEVKKDSLEVKSFEPYHMSVKISGNGYFDGIKPIEFNIDGVKVFASEPVKNVKLSNDGYNGVWSQKFAFVSDKSFKVPEVVIEYFDLKTKTKKVLIVDSSDVNVLKGYDKKELLDNVDEEFTLNNEYLYYFLFFITGFLFGKIRFKRAKNIDENSRTFINKIDEVKDLNHLVVILAMDDRVKYEDLIYKIETKEINTLKSAKKELLSLI